ncbi:MAG TPA: hypothetical protein VH134_09945 [Candidatus Dormibacteraeota bacterium]|jgi:hypothetical protein|nr:hypothetical protein [Candidatus Dormibacteraeota bacterium]
MALAAVLLAGCEEARIVEVTPSPSPAATATLPPFGYNHRYGDNPVAAADGFRLERQLIARGDYWEVAVSTEPAAAGELDHPSAAGLVTARAAARRATLTVATEIASTIRALLARGRAGQQAYCAGLLDQLRAFGYTGLESAHVDVYFTERDRHAELTWTPTSSGYAVFDGDLGGDLSRLPGGTTPFPAPPAP